jgi:hypothetical protein
MGQVAAEKFHGRCRGATLCLPENAPFSHFLLVLVLEKGKYEDEEDSVPVVSRRIPLSRRYGAVGDIVNGPLSAA